MSAAPPPPRGSSGALYSLVAWPPAPLDSWLRRTQERLNVRAFGAPHLNLRAPFQTSLSAPELVAAFREVLRREPAFDVRVKGWKALPHMIFLEFEPDASLTALHQRVLTVEPSSRASHDGDGYLPHLTLALGILPWAEDAVWEAVQPLVPPLQSFHVNVLSLTREERGEVQEVHTFPLQERSLAGPIPLHLPGARLPEDPAAPFLVGEGLKK